MHSTETGIALAVLVILFILLFRRPRGGSGSIHPLPSNDGALLRRRLQAPGKRVRSLT